MYEIFALSCGNGLLTHILTAEGYDGKGIDLRACTSWLHYPQTTQNNLHVHMFDPSLPDSFLKEGIFIIGNHTDKLTPWLPVLSTIHSASGYLSIPCCSWTFEAKYERSSTDSVATAIAEVFRKNAISVGRKFAKMLKIFDKIDGIKSRRVI